MEGDSNAFPLPPSLEEINQMVEISPKDVILEMDSTTPQIDEVTNENIQKSVKKKKKSKSKEVLEENEEEEKENVKKAKKKKKKADTIIPEHVTAEGGSSKTCSLRKNKNYDLDKEVKKKKSKKLNKAVRFFLAFHPLFPLFSAFPNACFARIFFSKKIFCF